MYRRKKPWGTPTLPGYSREGFLSGTTHKEVLRKDENTVLEESVKIYLKFETTCNCQNRLIVSENWNLVEIWVFIKMFICDKPDVIF